MTAYTAHLKPGREPVLVKEAFAWGAALLGPLWLALRGAWIPAALHLLVLVAIIRLVPAPARGPVLLAQAVLAGLVGRDLVRWTLARRGFALAHVLVARDHEAALGRLLAIRPELAASYLMGLAT